MLHSNLAAAPPLCESHCGEWGCMGWGKGLGGSPGSQIRLFFVSEKHKAGVNTSSLTRLMSLRMSLMSATEKQQSRAYQSLMNNNPKDCAGIQGIGYLRLTDPQNHYTVCISLVDTTL